VNSYLHTITSLSTDTIILIAIVAVIFFAGIQLGRAHLVSSILSLYIASFLYTHVFFVKTLTIDSNGSSNLFWNHIGIFMIFYLPLHFIMNRVVSMDYDRGASRYVKVGLLAFAMSGLILSLLYHLIPLDPVYNFSGAIDSLFASNTAFTIWLIIPLILLFF
jgi:hypothetical protein